MARVRRDLHPAPVPYHPAPVHPAPVYGHAPAHKGRVGPVYTFVKTDPQVTTEYNCYIVIN